MLSNERCVTVQAVCSDSEPKALQAPKPSDADLGLDLQGWTAAFAGREQADAAMARLHTTHERERALYPHTLNTVAGVAAE